MYHFGRKDKLAVKSLEKAVLFICHGIYFAKRIKTAKKSDLSRKGSIDEKIIGLVDFINNQNCYVTTSSCSGRISVFTNSVSTLNDCYITLVKLIW